MPRISVAMVTYAHEAYLAEAIESVLAQDLEDWELVIGEDDSPDGTRAVAERFAAEHPDRVRLLDSTENLGGRRNFARVLGACRGTYLTALDGDDYFTAPDRLSTMVALLDAEPGLDWAYHAVEEVDDAGRPLGRVVRDGRYPVRSRRDLLRANPAASSGVVHRRPERLELPDWWWRCPVGDWATHLLLTRTGRVAYVDRVLAAHRNHGAAFWSTVGLAGQVDLRGRCRAVLAEAFDEDVSDVLREGAFLDRYDRGRAYEREGAARAAAADYAWCWRHRADGGDLVPRGRLFKRRLRAAARALLAPAGAPGATPPAAEHEDAPGGVGGARAPR